MDSLVGKVSLVGAGPGDPDLLTLRGRRLLESADVVLYDYLVDSRMLSHCRADARLICLGRHGTGRLLSQEQVQSLLVSEARSGNDVVRLKGGDACLFGRLAEEIAALEAAQLAYEVVPGVTAAAAASATTGIPLTHRDVASGVAFVTGQQAADGREVSLDYAALAQFPGTLVIYMGVTTAPSWSQSLLEHGKPASTPAAIVRHASLAYQQTWITTLGDVGALLGSGKIRPPVVVLIGETVARRATFDWFGSRPLVGQTVLVTRPTHQADALGEKLAELGAQVHSQPAILIGDPDDWGPLDDAIDQLAATDWVAFSSANGVQALCDRLAHHGRDLRALGGVRLAAIGPATSQALAWRGLRCDLMPQSYRAEDLADVLARAAQGKRCLLIRASRGRETLAEMLLAAGVDVRQATAYSSRDVESPDPAIVEALATGQIDWVTVTSSAIARSLVRLFGGELSKARLAAISPLTATALAELGHVADAVATTFDVPGVVESIVRKVAMAQNSETPRGGV